MKKYLVGGYTRDRLMGIRAKDKDYVIVGASESDIKYLQSIGYKQVGKDFPVYLSPEGNEHALARTERKTGTGYGGFEVNTKGVTLEQDLYRRDLTINAIAYDPVLQIHIDPYGGKSDIKNKVLRHVSEHFKEDPLRVLRLARFATRYSDFTIHDDTMTMCKDMVSTGELDHLVPDRVFVEFEKALSEENPSKFIKTLVQFGYYEKAFTTVPVTKKRLELIDSIAANCTEEYKPYFLWTVLLENEEVNNDSVLNGSIKVPVKYVKFSNYIKRFREDIKTFRKKTPVEMGQILLDMNIKNNGGEDFLYKVLENFILNKEIDSELEDLIIKVYDRYTDVELPDIQQLVKDGELQTSEIRDFVAELRIEAIKQMF
ncbi:CCA-adding protein [Escherichia coli]